MRGMIIRMKYGGDLNDLWGAGGAIIRMKYGKGDYSNEL